MEVVVRDVRALKEGIEMEIYDETDTELVKEDVHADFVCDNCDTPAARKISGTAAHSHDFYPCIWCRCVLLDAERQQGYNPNCKFVLLMQSQC